MRHSNKTAMRQRDSVYAAAPQVHGSITAALPALVAAHPGEVRGPA
jgi:hypothetical protein